MNIKCAIAKNAKVMVCGEEIEFDAKGMGEISEAGAEKVKALNIPGYEIIEKGPEEPKEEPKDKKSSTKKESSKKEEKDPAVEMEGE